MSDHDHHDHPHDHHDHDDGSRFSDVELRVKALESLLVRKGLVDPATLDRLVDTYETRIGPRNGARVVARAWTDPAYRQRLLEDATAAIAELGYTGLQGEHMVVVENTPRVHNLVVCTLCSCYPWPVLGLPPVWYKSYAYRSRAVIDPRGVLAEFGLTLDPEVEVRVWDSTAEIRYLVLPERPEGSDRTGRRMHSPTGLARFDDRRGARTGPAPAQRRHRMNGVHDMGGMHGFGPVGPERDEPVFHHAWEGRVFAMRLAASMLGRWNIDIGRHAVERMDPAEYLASTYYERWLASLETLLIEAGLATREEIDSGVPTGAAPASLRVPAPNDVDRIAAKGRNFRVDADIEPRFRVGDAIVTRNDHPLGHTRLPRYARARHGVIERVHGVFVFADTSGSKLGDKPQHLYSVRFTARELFGPAAPAPDTRAARSLERSPRTGMNPAGSLAARPACASTTTAPCSGRHGKRRRSDSHSPSTRRGAFTWQEWAATLGAEIAAATARDGPDDGSRYYEHWLAALERLTTQKHLASADELRSCKEAWDRAARATPHGKPIVLAEDDIR